MKPTANVPNLENSLKLIPVIQMAILWDLQWPDAFNTSFEEVHHHNLSRLIHGLNMARYSKPIPLDDLINYCNEQAKKQEPLAVAQIRNFAQAWTQDFKLLDEDTPDDINDNVHEEPLKEVQRAEEDANKEKRKSRAVVTPKAFTVSVPSCQTCQAQNLECQVLVGGRRSCMVCSERKKKCSLVKWGPEGLDKDQIQAIEYLVQVLYDAELLSDDNNITSYDEAVSLLPPTVGLVFRGLQSVQEENRGLRRSIDIIGQQVETIEQKVDSIGKQMDAQITEKAIPRRILARRRPSVQEETGATSDPPPVVGDSPGPSLQTPPTDKDHHKMNLVLSEDGQDLPPTGKGKRKVDTRLLERRISKRVKRESSRARSYKHND